MLKKHSYPKTILIELNAIANMVAYMLNDVSNSNVLNVQSAFPIAYGITQYHVNLRCKWLKRPDLYMNTMEHEQLLKPLDLPDDYKSYLITHCRNELLIIEDVVSDFLNPYIEMNSWGLWSMERVSSTTIKLINEGDYRIQQWAENEIQNQTPLAQAFRPEILRRE